MPLTSQQLLARHCEPSDDVAPLTCDEAAAQAAAMPGWRVEGVVLCRGFSFPDFRATMAFVNAVAAIAHREDHHPEMTLSYSHCALRYTTHATGSLTLNDFVCAAHIDALGPDG